MKAAIGGGGSGGEVSRCATRVQLELINGPLNQLGRGPILRRKTTPRLVQKVELVSISVICYTGVITVE